MSGPLVGAFVGSAVGLGVGLCVGVGVGSAVCVARGVGCAVGVVRGVGAGVLCGAEDGPFVELGWLGAGVRSGAWLGWAGTIGELDATAIDGLAPAGLGLATPLGEAPGEAEALDGELMPLAGLPDGADALGPLVDGVGVASWAIWLG